MFMDITIRPYKNEDYQDIQKLLIDTGLYFEAIDTKEHFAKKLQNDPESILVAIEQNKIIGTVFLLQDNGWVAFVFHLAVNKNYQGKGVGRKLMEEAEKIIRRRNGYQIHALVDTKNDKVIGFYNNLGFYPDGEYLWMLKELK